MKKFTKIATPLIVSTFLLASTVGTGNSKEREQIEPDFYIGTRGGIHVLGFSYTPANDPSMRCSGVVKGGAEGGIANTCWKAEPATPTPKPAAPSDALKP